MSEKPSLDISCLATESKASTTVAINLLSEFKIGDSCYQVIVFSHANLEDNDETLLSSFLLNKGLKECSEVVRFVINGQLCIIVESTSKGFLKVEQKDISDYEITSLLTERELQIAALVALGKVNKQIAKQLHISEWTVATYLRRMFAKLRVDSRAALVYRCAPLIRRFQEMNVMTTES